MEEPSDELHEKQKPGRKYDRELPSLGFGSEWTALGCLDPNNNNNNKICCLQLPRELHRSTTLLQLTGRWPGRDNVISITLHQV